MGYKKYSDLGKPKQNEAIKPNIKPTNTIEQFVMPKKLEKVLFNLESKEHLNKVLQKYRVIIVDTWANWCGPCKHISPKFEILARQHAKNKDILFMKDDIDNDNSPHKNEVNAIPTFFFYLEGKKQEKLKYTGADITNVEKNLNKIIEFCRKNPR